MKKTKISLIGFGYWGPNVAKNIYKNNDMELSSICDHQESRLKVARLVYIEQTSYELNYKKILLDPEIDAVAIAVETSGHFKLTKEALLSGKHVYIEKPFTNTVTEAEELKELADSLNLIIHVDHIMIYHPVIKRIKNIFDSGELGDILYFDSMRMNLGQIKKDVSAMWDLSIHDLSIVDYITNGKLPTYVNAIGEKHYNPKESLCHLSLKYGNFLAHMQSSWISPLKERRIVLAGTLKMVVYDDMKSVQKLMIYDKGVDVINGDDMSYSEYAVKTREGDVHAPYIEQEDALFNSLEHFRSCLISGLPSISGTNQAIRLQKILEAADKKMNEVCDYEI
jgi:predicted dehydrogenase